jgi:citrate synthase
MFKYNQTIMGNVGYIVLQHNLMLGKKYLDNQRGNSMQVKNPWPNVDAHSGVLLQYFGLKEEK